MPAKQRSQSMHFLIDANGSQALQQLTPNTQSDTPVEAVTTETTTTKTILYIDTDAFDFIRRGISMTVQPDEERYLVSALRHPLPDPIDNMSSTLPQAVTAHVHSVKRALAPERWPKALRESVSQVPAANASCRPVALVDVSRHQQTLALPPVKEKGQPSAATTTLPATLAQVRVALPTADLSAQFDGDATIQVATLYEVKIDDGATKLAADAVQQRLQQVADVTVVAESRLAQILAILGTYVSTHVSISIADDQHVSGMDGEHRGIQPTMTMAEACRMLMYQQLLEMIRQEAGVRYSAEIEYVHQMRVAIRRLRAAAKLFGHSLARKQLRPYLKQVRKTGRLLGIVRDLDVAIEKAQKRKRTRNVEQIAQWRGQRKEHHATLVHWLDGDEYRRFLADFLAYCAPAVQNAQASKPPKKRKAKCACTAAQRQPVAVEPEAVRHVVPALLMEQFAAVRAYEACFEQDGPIPYATLHQLRIQCKYLRYSLEFTQHLLGEESQGVLKQLKQLQELLGDLNDAVVALQMVDAQQAKRRTAKEKAYRDHQSEVIDTLRAKVPARLAGLVGPAQRRQLALAIARL